MPDISTGEARNNLATVVNRVTFGKERVTLTRRGKPVAAVVPLEDVELLEALEDRLDLEAAREAMREPGTVPWEKIKADLGL